MKTQHRLLRSDQNPVEDGLLFRTELGKSVKDLSESSKVTSKVTLKQKRHHSSSHTFQGCLETKDHFISQAGAEALSPFKQRGGYQKSPERNQPPYQRQRQ